MPSSRHPSLEPSPRRGPDSGWLPPSEPAPQPPWGRTHKVLSGGVVWGCLGSKPPSSLSLLFPQGYWAWLGQPTPTPPPHPRRKLSLSMVGDSRAGGGQLQLCPLPASGYLPTLSSGSSSSPVCHSDVISCADPSCQHLGYAFGTTPLSFPGHPVPRPPPTPPTPGLGAGRRRPGGGGAALSRLWGSCAGALLLCSHQPQPLGVAPKSGVEGTWADWSMGHGAPRTPRTPEDGPAGMDVGQAPAFAGEGLTAPLCWPLSLSPSTLRFGVWDFRRPLEL